MNLLLPSKQPNLGGRINLEKLGILIGLLLTDGSVSKKERSWRITFSGRSEELHRIFKEISREIFGIQNFNEYIDKRDIKSTSFWSTEIAEFLRAYCNGFRTKSCESSIICHMLRGIPDKKPCVECNPVKISDTLYPNVHLPGFFYNLPKESIAKILRAMYSADGSAILGIKWNKVHKSWQFTRYIQLTCSNPLLLSQLDRLLKEKFEMRPQKWKRNIALERKDDIIRFRDEIGFVDGVKISYKSKQWEGTEKNKLLEIMVTTFELKKKDLEKFSSKGDIISFVKSTS